MTTKKQFQKRKSQKASKVRVSLWNTNHKCRQGHRQVFTDLISFDNILAYRNIDVSKPQSMQGYRILTFQSLKVWKATYHIRSSHTRKCYFLTHCRCILSKWVPTGTVCLGAWEQDVERMQRVSWNDPTKRVRERVWTDKLQHGPGKNVLNWQLQRSIDRYGESESSVERAVTNLKCLAPSSVLQKWNKSWWGCFRLKAAEQHRPNYWQFVPICGRGYYTWITFHILLLFYIWIYIIGLYTVLLLFWKIRFRSTACCSSRM